MSAYRLDDKYRYPYQDYQDTPVSKARVSFTADTIDKKMSNRDLDDANELLTPSPLRSIHSLASSGSSASSSASSSSPSSPSSRLESTMLALKDLQLRVRKTQEARDEARRQRDNMRIEVIERCRLSSLHIQQAQEDAIQQINSINNDCKDCKLFIKDTTLELYSIEDECRSNEIHITSQQNIISNLDDDVMEINSIIRKLEGKNMILIEQLAKIEDNCDVLHLHSNALKCDKDLLINDTANYNKIVYMRGAISSIANQLKDVCFFLSSS